MRTFTAVVPHSSGIPYCSTAPETSTIKVYYSTVKGYYSTVKGYYSTVRGTTVQ